MRPVAHYMTTQPWTVQLDDSIAVARQMMAEREIHHLPVLDGSELVGMVTERDLYLLGPRLGVTVEEAMSAVHGVEEDRPLDEVVEQMAERGWDAVVVRSERGVEGIFTAMDSLRVLASMLRRRAA